MQLSVKAFNSKKTIIFSTLGTLVLLIALIVGLLVFYPLKNSINFETLINSFLERVNLRDKSYASLAYEGNTIKLNFDIAPEDVEKATKFSKKLDIRDDWMEGMSLTLDQKTVNLLRDSLPEKVALEFEDQGVSFSSQSSPKLKSSLSEKNYQLATTSGSLTLNASSQRDYDLKIVEPLAVLEYADAQGKIYLSTRAEGLLPLIEKVARIEIQSRNGEVKGSIRIKSSE